TVSPPWGFSGIVAPSVDSQAARFNFGFWIADFGLDASHLRLQTTNPRRGTFSTNPQREQGSFGIPHDAYFQEPLLTLRVGEANPKSKISALAENALDRSFPLDAL